MVLVTGLILAVISAVVEFVWNARKTAARDKVSSFSSFRSSLKTNILLKSFLVTGLLFGGN